MIFISQDGLKAISAEKVDFFVVMPERKANGKFNLLAKNQCSQTLKQSVNMRNLD